MVLLSKKTIQKKHSALMSWVRLISFSFSGLLMIFIADYFSGIAFLGYPFELFPVLVTFFAFLLLLPLFNRLTKKRMRLELRVWLYPAIWLLWVGAVYSTHGYLQGGLTPEALRVESGHCAALTHLLISKESETQMLDAFVKQLSPMKQYAYFFAEQNCKANRIYQAIQVRPLTLCGSDLTRTPYDCFSSLMKQGKQEGRKSVIETELDYKIGNDLIDSGAARETDVETLLVKLEHTLNSLQSLEDRKRPQE